MPQQSLSDFVSEMEKAGMLVRKSRKKNGWTSSPASWRLIR